MKRSYLVVLALVLGLGLGFGPAYGQDEATTKQADIKKLLGITGASNTGLRVFSQVIGMFQRAHSEVPEAVWMEMVSKAEENDPRPKTVGLFNPGLPDGRHCARRDVSILQTSHSRRATHRPV